ncbi:MAG: PAS domain S-box protein, partial [Pseudomonadota bacterium]
MRLDPFDAAHDAVLPSAHEAIITVDQQQCIVMINPAALSMFGCTAEDALGSNLSRIIAPPHRESLNRRLCELATSAVNAPPLDKRAAIVGLHTNGHEFPAEVVISRQNVAAELGTRRYFTVLIRDMRREAALASQIQALKQAMRAIFELAPVAIWITEGDTIVYANRSSAALFGAHDREALVGQSIYALLKPESHASVRQQIDEALSNGIPIPMLSERIARMDGEVRDVMIAVAALPDHGQTAAQMVISDVTERMQEHQEMARSRDQLQRLSAELVTAREEERRRIARELHDELGQRLTALKMELSSLAPALGHEVMASRIAGMLKMVDETVTSVRRIATELRPMMLDDLGLKAAIESLARDSERHMGIQITLELDEACGTVGDAAAIALYRMVQEALTNIARHAQATRARIEIRPQHGKLLLKVQDNGVGIPEPTKCRAGSHGL